jgi:tRNA (guanine37-N1)-methyltransferase
MLNIRIFSLYPELFPGPLDIGLYKKARRKKIWSLEIINIRDYTKDKHKTVDDTPYGGGNGMLMRADVIGDALNKMNKLRGLYFIRWRNSFICFS